MTSSKVGSPAVATAEMRQSSCSKRVGNSKFQARQWIPPKTNDEMAIMVVTNGTFNVNLINYTDHAATNGWKFYRVASP